MITVTPDAAEQIRFSARESGINDATLRIAIKQLQDKSLHYAMGFDEAISDTDLRFETEGVKLVVAESSKALADGMTIDFVELEDGEKNFIFLNPNDSNYSPPIE